jgi:regulator of protease activity HflC (stomatin/prohibitin superfamily)
MSLSKELRLVMEALVIVLVIVVILLLIGAAMSVRVVKQYEQGVLFRLGKVLGARPPGLRIIIPFIDVLHRVSLRIVTMPIQSQGIITQDNVSVDVSAVAYFRVVDAVKSVVAIENVYSAIDQIAQTTLRKVVGQHSLDQTLSETDKINLDIRKILDVSTVEWGVEVTLVELKDIQLPDTMKRAMAKQAEAEREKRAKIINAEGESLAAAALGDASDIMMAHPLALQLRNLQSLVEIGVDKNTTVVFPAPLMTTIAELGSFLAGEKAAAGLPAAPPVAIPPALIPAGNGTPVNGAPANGHGPAAAGPPATTANNRGEADASPGKPQRSADSRRYRRLRVISRRPSLGHPASRPHRRHRGRRDRLALPGPGHLRHGRRGHRAGLRLLPGERREDRRGRGQQHP